MKDIWNSKEIYRDIEKLFVLQTASGIDYVMHENISNVQI